MSLADLLKEEPPQLGHIQQEEEGVFLDLDTLLFFYVDRLKPQDTPLEFHSEFVLEVATNPALPNMGTYTNGWEL